MQEKIEKWNQALIRVGVTSEASRPMPNKVQEDIGLGIQDALNELPMDGTRQAVILAIAEKNHAIPDPFLEAFYLRHAKGDDYDNVPGGRSAYFPFGLQSYVMMIYTKALRLLSLALRPRAPKNESIRDSAVDAINYNCYLAEAIDRKEICHGE